MAEGFLRAWGERAARHRRALAAVVLSLLALCGALLPRLPFDTSLESMLPEGSRAQAMIRYLREAGLAEVVVLTLSCEDAVPEADAFGLLRRGEAELRATAVKPPLITGLLTPGAGVEAGAGLDLSGLVPVLFDAGEQARVQALAEPAALRSHLRSLFLRQLGPQSMYAADRLRSDPLGLEERRLRELLELSTANGFHIAYRDGLLLDDQGRHAMVLLQTAAAVTDGEAARRLVAHLDALVAALPAGLRGSYVCAHRHTVSNEQLLRRDIAITSTAETIIFFILLLTCFRDPRSAVLIFLVPPAAALLSLPLVSVAAGPLSLLVIGLGAVIAGVSVDYGIHAYVASRHAGSGAAGAAHAAGPVVCGMITVSALFLAFAFSAIAGYRQLAAFAILSLVGSVVLALGVLPHFVRLGRATGAAHPAAAQGTGARPRDRVAVGVWLIAILAALPLLRGVPFDGRLSHLDGVSPEIRAAEAELDSRWRAGAARQAIVAVTAKDREEALRLNSQVWAALSANGLQTGVVSLARLWPDAATRDANRARWRGFWSGAQGSQLLADLAAQAPASGFSGAAFQPFAARVAADDAPPDPATHPLLKSLWLRLVHERGGQWHVFTYVPDDPAQADALDRALAAIPEARLVSAAAIDRALSGTFTTEIGRITLRAVLAVLLALTLLVRRWRLVLVALIPPVSGVAGLAVAMRLTGLSANVVNLMAGVVVFGLSMDYSYTLMHGLRHRTEGASRLVIHLSAVTTMVGAGVLLLARHPALFSIGLTLTIGVVCGYLAALLVIPAVARLWRLHDS